MDTELKNKLEILEKKVDVISKDIRIIKGVFLWSFILTVAFIVLPLVGMVFVIPKFISSIDISSYEQLLGM